MRSGPGVATAIVALAIGSFTAGWFVGRTTAQDAASGARIEALREEVAALAAGRREEPRAAARPAREEPDVRTVEIGGAPVRGPEDAPVTIVEFSDFQCPYCTRVRPTLEKVKEEYGDRVRLVFKHFPLSFHTKAIPAHKAAIAAGRQGRFWEMHDLIFENPRELEAEQLRGHAETLGLDLAQYDADVASKDVTALIEADQAQAAELGVRGTPSFFINGRFFSGAQPYAAFKARIDAELERLQEG